MVPLVRANKIIAAHSKLFNVESKSECESVPEPTSL